MNPFEQFLSAEQYREYQLEALNEALAYAKRNSRFWLERLSGFGALRSLEELASLPLCSARDIIERGAAMVCLPQSAVARIVSLESSGSARRKRLWFSDGDLERTVEFFAEGMKYLCRGGERAAIFFPDNENGVSSLLSRALARIGVSAEAVGPVSEENFSVPSGADILIGLPAQLRALALADPGAKVKGVLLSADYIPRGVCELIGRIWGCPVLAHYGLTESGLGCAVQCAPGSAMHIRHDELILEIIDPETEKVLPFGSEGEIVITTLRREAMPLFRYRTGDIGALSADKCSCGSELPRLSYVKGRAEELKKKINIHILDDIFLSRDDIIDYTARMDGTTLAVSVFPESAIPAARAALKAAFPALPARFEAGGLFKSTGVFKRRIF